MQHKSTCLSLCVSLTKYCSLILPLHYTTSLCRIVVTLNLVTMATALSSGEYWSVRNPCASVCAAIGAFLRIHGPA